MVASLSKHQIRRIKERISKEGVSASELAEDLLDHLCICVEEEMENGLSFEKAFEKVFASLEEDELKLTEMKTQELLEGKKIFYPNLLQSFGLMALVIGGYIVIFWWAIRVIFKEQFIEAYYPFFLVITNLIVLGGVMAYAIREIRQTQGKALIFSFRPVPTYVYLVVACIALLSRFWMEPLAMLWLGSPETMIKPLWKHDLMVVLLAASFNVILSELLFRGIILKGLLKTFTPVKAIFWSSLIYMSVYFWAPLYMFTFGLMLGWIYWKTKSLYPTIFMKVMGALVGYCTLFYMGPWGELFTWKEWFGNLWLYAGVMAVSFLLTAGLFYYLHRKLSGSNQP